MPTTPGCQPSPASTNSVPVSELRDLGLGLPGDPLLDRSPLGVELVELGGDLGGALLVVGQQQLEAGVGAPQPAGGVDPRSEPESERLRRRARWGRARATLISARRPGLARPRPAPPDRRGRAGGSRRAAASGRRPSRARPARGRRRRSAASSAWASLYATPVPHSSRAGVATDRRVHDRAVR